MNGEIELNSSLDKGTTISVTLPLAVYDGPVMESPDENRQATINLSGFRILLAEDDETTRILLTESLRSAGAAVEVAEDGSKAWELFNENKSGYDLVMTDIQMPDLSGPELAERISNSEETSGTSHPPILGLTAHATNEELERFRQMGINSILIKPFRHYQLVAAIEEY